MIWQVERSVLYTHPSHILRKTMFFRNTQSDVFGFCEKPFAEIIFFREHFTWWKLKNVNARSLTHPCALQVQNKQESFYRDLSNQIKNSVFASLTQKFIRARLLLKLVATTFALI